MDLKHIIRPGVSSSSASVGHMSGGGLVCESHWAHIPALYARSSMHLGTGVCPRSACLGTQCPLQHVSTPCQIQHISQTGQSRNHKQCIPGAGSTCHTVPDQLITNCAARSTCSSHSGTMLHTEPALACACFMPDLACVLEQVSCGMCTRTAGLGLCCTWHPVQTPWGHIACSIYSGCFSTCAGSVTEQMKT